MKLAEKPKEAVFLSRKNRFSCLVDMSGREETVYLANSGRLEAVLFPGQTVFLVDRESPKRMTSYDLIMTRFKGVMVSVDSRVPGDVVYEALCQRVVMQFNEYSTIKREVTFGKSRLDFCLSRGDKQCFLEVKSVTLVVDGVARFPDAPTERGRKHLESLMQAKEEGHEAAVLFVIQRQDADRFSPNDIIDPDFGRALREAHLRGVDIYAHCCQVSTSEILLAGQVPVKL